MNLKKQIAAAPKYVLKVINSDLYLSDTQKLSGCNLTNDIKEARQFAFGFDNPTQKIGIWSATAKLKFESVVI